MKKQLKYVIITPVRNEEKYLEKTIQSVIKQRIKPAEWIIVNDGSTDGTAAIIQKYVVQYGWIREVRREDRGFRKSGGGVIEAFYDGYAALESKEWDFIVKLDGDLNLSPDYFDRCFLHFAANPKLGIGGGVISHLVNGEIVVERSPNFHVRGATKIYKKECWRELGGLIQAPGWDTLDEIKANMFGWETRSFEDLKLIHHRYTGSADGRWKGWVKNGRANYIVGYHPLFMILKCIKRVYQRPYLISSAGLLWGFMSGYMERIPQVDDRQVIKYIRREQLRKLMFRRSIWK